MDITLLSHCFQGHVLYLMPGPVNDIGKGTAEPGLSSVFTLSIMENKSKRKHPGHLLTGYLCGVLYP